MLKHLPLYYDIKYFQRQPILIGKKSHVLVEWFLCNALHYTKARKLIYRVINNIFKFEFSTSFNLPKNVPNKFNLFMVDNHH